MLGGCRHRNEVFVKIVTTVVVPYSWAEHATIHDIQECPGTCFLTVGYDSACLGDTTTTLAFGRQRALNLEQGF